MDVRASPPMIGRGFPVARIITQPPIKRKSFPCNAVFCAARIRPRALPPAPARDCLAPPMSLSLSFVAGTLELRGLAADAPAPAGCRWDPRAACHRAPAIAYADVVRAYHNKVAL